MTTMIRMKGITQTFHLEEIDLPVLKQIDLSIDDGEYVAIMGTSGSGKSTLMNIIGCLDRPTSGLYILDGRDLTTLDDDELADIRNQYIGFVFQQFNTSINSVRKCDVAHDLCGCSPIATPNSRNRISHQSWTERSTNKSP